MTIGVHGFFLVMYFEAGDMSVSITYSILDRHIESLVADIAGMVGIV